MNMSYLSQMSASYKTLCTGLLLLAASLLLASCDSGFLEEPPKGSLSGEVMTNRQGIETLLIGTYSALNPTNGGGAIAGGDPWMSEPSNWAYGSVASDDAQKGSEPNDQTEVNSIQENRFDPTSGYFDGVWSNRYEGVARANGVLQTLEEVEDLSDEERTHITAEARFLRGHFYFDLKKMFDNVPWIDETTEDVNQPNDQDIWPMIEADFEFAMNNLPETQDDEARPNSWAAATYLAKTYVYQEKWSEAKNLFDDIIANGVTASGVPYDLTENYSDNFNAATQGPDNPEIVFAVEMTGDDGSGELANSWSGMKLNYPFDSPFNCCGFYQPSYDLVNAFKTDASGLPMIDGYNADAYEHDRNVSSNDVFDYPTDVMFDPRLDWTVGRRGVPYHDHGPHPGARYIRNDHGYAGPFSPKKHVWRRANEDIARNLNSWAPGSGVDYPVIRFADVLLMAAEAEVEVGSVEQARQYVNRVRERAANPDGFVDNSLNEAFAAAEVTDESELANVDVSTGDWVVNTEDNVTYVRLSGGTWQEYPNPVDSYSIAEIPASEFSEDPRAYIHFERRLELAMEGHRFFDLVRWGEAEERLNAYFDFQGDLTRDVRGAQFQHEIFPIPQRQIDLSVVDGEPMLEQNPGY